MAKNILNKQNNVDMPVLLLQTRDFRTIGTVSHIHDFIYKENFNGPNELSFLVYKNVNGQPNPLWDSLISFKIIYIPEFQERFEISVSTSSSDTETKSVTGTSLCEAELSQVKLYNIEINTKNDILNGDYDANFPTVFYRDPDAIHEYDWVNSKHGGKYRDYSDVQKREVLRKSSLLHRILEKADHYSIGTVDKSLMNQQREFSISNTDIYSELTGEISEEFNCLFTFDPMSRTVSAHDLCNTCRDCGYRGDFAGQCPECGSRNFGGQYGKDTAVFISNENLAEEISLESNKDSLKNCFYVEGGDETITSAIRSVNPNSTNYIYDFSQEAKDDMPYELSSTIESYGKIYDEYLNARLFSLDSDAAGKYNDVVNEINKLFSEDTSVHFNELPCRLTGYSAVAEAIYEATDLYGFLKNSMMPTIRIDGLGLEDSLNSIISGFRDGFSKIDENGNSTTYFQNQIVLKNPATAIQSTVEAAIKKSAKLYYSTAYYELKLHTLSYQKAPSSIRSSSSVSGSATGSSFESSSGSLPGGPSGSLSGGSSGSLSGGSSDSFSGGSSGGTWTGTFTLTSLSQTDPDTGRPLTKTSQPVTLTISDDVELYVEQSIYRKVTEFDKAKYGEVTSLQMDFDTFQEKIALYSFSELSGMMEAFEACLDIIITADIFDQDLYGRYYSFYKKRLNRIDEELRYRKSQLEYVQKLYFFDSSEYKSSGLLSDIKNNVNNALNFKDYIFKNPLKHDSYSGRELWAAFCSYRREDKYTNSNYISDGMDNAQVIAHAKKLLDVAKKELYKASHIQYTLSASMENLLALKEFRPLADSFSCGNWIRVGMGDDVYRLRLLSYQVKFDDVSSIDVEFSTVEHLWSGNSDIKSVLESAKSMAGSYSYTAQQAKQSYAASKYVNGWVDEGLSATAAKIVNDHDSQSITIDRNGLLCRSYDDVEDLYSPRQAKFINNGLYFTTDNWDTVKAALGTYLYTLNDTEKTAYGLLAETIVGKLILGESLLIQNSSGSMSFDSSGLMVTNGENTIAINPNNKDRLFRIYNHSAEDIFYTDSSGNLSLAGKITAKADSKIGNLTVGESKLTYGNFGIDTSSTNANNTTLWLGSATASFAPFRVTYGGKLYAAGADIRGKITAAEGTIGGFNIGESYLANNATALGTTAGSVYLGTDGISCGTAFKVTKDGIVKLDSAQSVLEIRNPTSPHETYSSFKPGSLQGYDYSVGPYMTRQSYNCFSLSREVFYNSVSARNFSSGRLYLKGESIYDGSFVETIIRAQEARFGGIIYEDGTALSSKYASASHTHSYLPLAGGTMTGNITQANNKALLGTASTESLCNLIRINSSDNIHIGGYGDYNTKSPVYLHSENVQYNFTDTYLGPNATNAQTLGESSKLWKTVYAKTGAINTSDRNKKHDIQDIPDKYIDLFYHLKPKIFMFNGGDRIHVGAISQDVEEAMASLGMTALDFGGFCKDIRYEYQYDEDGCEIESSKKPVRDTDGNIVYDYSMRYQEFDFMHIEATHRLKKENECLKERVSRLEDEIASLTAKLSS